MPLDSPAADSPIAVFGRAQRALAAGDWDAFFACLDAADLRRLAAMVLPIACDSEPFSAICREHGVSARRIDRIGGAGAAIVASAASIVDPAPDASPADRAADSLRHRDLVKALDACLADAVGEVADLAAFVAASERFRRATSGGGSVSSSLFLDEQLVDLVVSDRQARAVRRRRTGGDDPIGFVLRRHGWRIRLFVNRRI
jgi:hypothetical protein